MLRVGRPRTKGKDLPLGVYLVDGRYHVRPVNEEMRRVFAIAFPGRKSAPLGADKAEARKAWVKLFITDLPEDTAAGGTVAELIERYEREIIPAAPEGERAEHERHCRNLKARFGDRRYARSEVEASMGTFLRSADVTRDLDKQAKLARPVQGNREIQKLSRIFRLAKTRWGYTEYNPCLQVEFNPEPPRSVYRTDDDFMRVYNKAGLMLQCMMDLAQMHGARRGMLIKATLACLTDDGVLLPLNKKKRTDPQRYQLIKWSDDLRAVVNRWLEQRAKLRGGQKNVTDADTAPLFLNRKGKALTKTGFNSLWYRARSAAGFGKHEFHFHDIKAKSVSDSPNIIDAMERGGHTDIRTTRGVYRRKPTEVIPLPAVSRKGSKPTPV